MIGISQSFNQGLVFPPGGIHNPGIFPEMYSPLRRFSGALRAGSVISHVALKMLPPSIYVEHLEFVNAQHYAQHLAQMLYQMLSILTM